MYVYVAYLPGPRPRLRVLLALMRRVRFHPRNSVSQARLCFHPRHNSMRARRLQLPSRSLQLLLELCLTHALLPTELCQHLQQIRTS